MLLFATFCSIIAIVVDIVSNIILSYGCYYLLVIIIEAYYYYCFDFDYSFNTYVASFSSLTARISSSMPVTNSHASTTHTV